MSSAPGHLFCFGYGYSAHALAKRLKAQGWRVSGTHRPGDNVADDDIPCVPFDRDTPLENFPKTFQGVTHVLISIPPDAQGDPVLDVHGRNLQAVARDVRWVGYLSTVGVYGDAGGKSVDEKSPLRPTQERSRFRALAETRWQNLAAASGLKLEIFRLAGIYGPGRSVLDKIRKGRAPIITKPDHKFSRIHVDDIANVLEAAIAHPHPGEIWNVCDDDPAEPADVTTYGYKLLGLDAPAPKSYDAAVQDMSPMARTFWADNRLVDNAKLKRKLGPVLQYPDYKTGLKAVLAAGG